MTRAELTALHAAIATILAWPPVVLDEVRRWLTPEAARLPPRGIDPGPGVAKPNGADPHPGNGLDPHPTPTAPGKPKETFVADRPQVTPPPAKVEHRAPPNAAHARGAEQKLMSMLREAPNQSARALARATGDALSTTKTRLRRMEERGAINKDPEGRWRLAGEAPRPTEASPS